MAYRQLDETDPNLQFNVQEGDSAGHYIVSVPRGRDWLLEKLRQLFASDVELYEEESDELPRVYFDRHLYQPLLIESAGGPSSEIKTIPLGLKESERRFVEDLKRFWTRRTAESPGDGTEIFLLRNLSRSGVGFFENVGFYPDFILWIARGGEQRIVFIEPHGMIHAPAYANDEKAKLHEWLPELAERMAKPPGVSRVELDSFIVSATPYETLCQRYDNGSWTREQFAEKHILFQDELHGEDYIAKLF